MLSALVCSFRSYIIDKVSTGRKTWHFMGEIEQDLYSDVVAFHWLRALDGHCTQRCKTHGTYVHISPCRPGYTGQHSSYLTEPNVSPVR
jgi:hypothetical protein